MGLRPPPRVAGGTVLRSRPRPTPNRAAAAVRLAAASLQQSQRALGASCRRMKSRGGTPQAVPAPAHTLARRISSMRKQGTA